jgi:porin
MSRLAGGDWRCGISAMRRLPKLKAMALKFLWLSLLMAFSVVSASGQENKKTDDDKPADPDTGESTIEEATLGLLPNPFQKHGIKFAAT